MKGIVFVDFVGTLYNENKVNEYKNFMPFSTLGIYKKFFSGNNINHDVIDFIVSKHYEGYEIKVIASISNKVMDAAKLLCDEYELPISEYITTSDLMTKSDIIKSYKSYFNIENENIILIDDSEYTRSELSNYITVLSPGDIKR